MPRSAAISSKQTRRAGSGKRKSPQSSRYSVGLPSPLAREVERYADTADASMSKAIVTLVRLGLETQKERKQAFFRKLKVNLAVDDPSQQDRMIDDFRELILGR